MKKMKKFFALLIAMVMVLGTMSITAFADTTTVTTTSDGSTTTVTSASSESFTMTINVGNTNTSVTHTYEAYQIFDGDLLIEIDQTADPATTTKTLSNIVWGSGVSTTATVDGKTLIETLAANSSFSGVTTAADVAKKLDGADSDAAIAQTFADIVSQFLSSTHTDSTATTSDGVVTGYTISGLEAGYYLVKDKDDSVDNKNDFYTRFVMEVVSDVTSTPKGQYPSVDKLVSDDETEDTATWYEAADHELYESFQFKLTATIPADVDIAKYETYKVVFTDTMSTGVTFEKIDSVKVNDTAVSTGYSLSENIYKDSAWVAMNGDGSTAWTLTFADILTTPGLTDAEKTKDVTIEVIYSAHLNNSALTYNADQTNVATNNNKVKLTYSNNPNAGGTGDTGDTPEDYVWVFAYKVDNTKYKSEASTGNEFGGAGFTLYASDGTTVIPLIYDSTKSAYRPLASTTEYAGYTYDATKTGASAFTAATSETVAADIKAYLVSADSTGLFNIIGLDEGTYKLVETVVPAGYNKCDDITITIAATTTENTSTAGADLVMTGSSNVSNSVINNAGTELPSTGGIGTTIFYVVGAILVIGAGVILVTRRRMDEQ